MLWVIFDGYFLRGLDREKLEVLILMEMCFLGLRLLSRVYFRECGGGGFLENLVFRKESFLIKVFWFRGVYVRL